MTLGKLAWLRVVPGGVAAFGEEEEEFPGAHVGGGAVVVVWTGRFR